MPEDKKITKTSVVSALLWKALERTCSQGLNLVIQIILARILLPEDFGSIAILTAIIGYASIFVQAGLGTALIQKNNLEAKDVNTLFTGSMVVALLFYALLFLLAPFVAGKYEMPGLVWPLRVMSLTLFLSAINSIQTSLFTRQLRFKALFFRSLLAIPISGAVGILMAIKGFGLWALIFQTLVNNIVIVVYMSFDKQINIHFGFSRGSAKQLYSFSGKILLSGLVSGFSDTCRTLVIGKKYSTKELAYYDKAYTYSSLVTQIVSMSISNVMLPTFSRSQENKTALLNMVRKSVRMSSFVMFPILLCVCAAAKPFVLLLLTEKWAPAIPFFMLFCIFRMPGLISNIDKQMYYALGNSSISLYYEVFLLLTQVTTLFVTVPISVTAVAIGAFVVEMLGNFSLFIISSVKYGYNLELRFEDVRKPLINGTISALFVYSISFLQLSNLLTLMIQVVVAGIVYCLLSNLSHDECLYEVRDLFFDKIKKHI